MDRKGEATEVKTKPLQAQTWDRPNPYVHEVCVGQTDTDRLGHANNTAYLKWMEAASWQHIEPIGMDWAAHELSGKAMAITRTEIDYLAACYEGEVLQVATWITACDGRLSSERAFQIIRPSDGKTLVRAVCRYACIDLKSGRPVRMPESFCAAHAIALRQWQDDVERVSD